MSTKVPMSMCADFLRFMSLVDVPRHSHWRRSCWEWRGQLTVAWSKFGGNGSGYGKFELRVDGRKLTYRAHRFMAEMMVEDTLGDALVLHTCDNRKCVNPAHLSLGTHTENLQDQYDRRRR